MPVSSVDAAVPNGSVAVALVREHRVSLRVATTKAPTSHPIATRPVTATRSSTGGSVTGDGTESGRPSTTTAKPTASRAPRTVRAETASVTTSRFDAVVRLQQDHFDGQSQVHGHVETDGAVPEHYHVDYQGGRGPMGYLVTENGRLYRVVVGAC